MRRTALALALLAAAPLSAQMPAGHDHDHDAVVQGAPLPAGWARRLDRADANAASVRFVAQGSGFHFTGGPAAIFYRNRDAVARGDYTVRATFTQTKAPMHPEAYGLFVGGTDLQGPAQSYLYFVVRGDGKYLVKHRAGTEVHLITDWTDSPAIVKAGADGRATNALEVRVRADGVHLMANGQQVAVLPRDHTGDLRGIAGLRINHNLDVQVDRFRIDRGH